MKCTSVYVQIWPTYCYSNSASGLVYILNVSCTRVFAAPLEAVPCKRQAMAGALSHVVKNTTEAFLIGGTFEIVSFDYSSRKDFDYNVMVDFKSCTDKSMTTFLVLVKVKDVKRCSLRTKTAAC